MNQPLTPTRCPSCGQPNQCGQTTPDAEAPSCWCFGIEVPAHALAAIPESAKDKICLCPRCARGEPPLPR